MGSNYLTLKSLEDGFDIFFEGKIIIKKGFKTY